MLQTSSYGGTEKAKLTQKAYILKEQLNKGEVGIMENDYQNSSRLYMAKVQTVAAMKTGRVNSIFE